MECGEAGRVKGGVEETQVSSCRRWPEPRLVKEGPAWGPAATSGAGTVEEDIT